MIGRNEIFQVRKEIDNYIGSKVKIRANKGRKKIVVKQGTIQKTYPSIFIVELDNQEQEKTPINAKSRVVSYSYTDVLTHTVELSLCRES